MKNFAILGVAGYVAPKHLKAIKETGNNLVAACDPFDSVGVLDNFFDQCSYFREVERFDRYLEKLRFENSTNKIDYLSICSPNYLHDAHIRLGLRVGANIICEKPLVIKPWNIDSLIEFEKKFDVKVNTVLQLRYHPAVLELKKKVENAPKEKIFDIDLTYLTGRGLWYNYSWKGDKAKSGGLVMNIGIHFFDMLSWIFGDVEHSEVHHRTDAVCSGYIQFSRAKAKWFLSIDKNLLPKKIIDQGQTTFRSLTIDKEEFEFSGGFADLHTIVYKEALAGNGFGLIDSKEAIKIVHEISECELVRSRENFHPLAL